MIIGAHRLEDETLRLHEYSPGRSTAAFVFDPQRFAAHEKFFVEDVRRWAATRLAVRLPAGRTAVFGVSAGAELALAMGLRHPDIYGAVLCASPGAGYRPPTAPGSEEFTAIWDSNPVRAPGHRTKVITHPQLGQLRVNCDVLTVPEDDQQVVFVTADPGSTAARALRSLAAAV